MVEKDVLAPELAGDYTPAAAEDLKLFLSLYAETDFEALQCLERIVYVPDWFITTNDNDGPT